MTQPLKDVVLVLLYTCRFCVKHAPRSTSSTCFLYLSVFKFRGYPISLDYDTRLLVDLDPWFELSKPIKGGKPLIFILFTLFHLLTFPISLICGLDTAPILIEWIQLRDFQSGWVLPWSTVMLVQIALFSLYFSGVWV